MAMNNSLAEVHPELASEWSEKNLPLFPALAVSYYSNKKGLKAELGRMATESGFVRDTFEKVLRLKEILKFLNEDKFLREHLIYFQCLIRKIISSWMRERRLRRITYRISWC